MTIVNGDKIYASDFNDLKNQLNEKSAEARRNNINIDNIDVDYSHQIRRDELIHTENVNRIIRKFNELKASSYNKQNEPQIQEVSSGNIIQLSYNSFIQIISVLQNITFEPPVGGLSIIGPSQINENSTTSYDLNKFDEGSQSGEKVTSGITWRVAGDAANVSTISSSGRLQVGDVSNDTNLIITAEINTDTGIKTTSKNLVIKQITDIRAIDIEFVDDIDVNNIMEGQVIRLFAYAIIDDQGTRQLLNQLDRWDVRRYGALDISNNESDYPGISIAKVRGIDIVNASENVEVTARYDGIEGKKTIEIKNTAGITNIYIIDKSDDDIFVLAGEPTTFSVFGSFTDDTRESILIDPSEITWSVVQDNNTESRFEGNVFHPGTDLLSDTFVLIMATYNSSTGPQTATRQVTIETFEEVDRVVILKQGYDNADQSQHIPLVEYSEAKLRCIVYFENGETLADPDEYVTWSFPNPTSSLINSGTSIDSTTGELVIGGFNYSTTASVRVNYRNTMGNRILNIKSVDNYKIGDINGTLPNSKNIDEGESWKAFFYAVCDDYSKVNIDTGIEWKFYDLNNNIEYPNYASIDRDTGDITTTDVDEDKPLKIGTKWTNPITNQTIIVYLPFTIVDLNYVTSVVITGPTTVMERNSIELSCSVTLDNGNTFSPDRNDNNLMWEIHNRGQLDTNNCEIRDDGELRIGSMTASQTTVSVKASYTRGGVTQQTYHSVSVIEEKIVTGIKISCGSLEGEPRASKYLTVEKIFDNNPSKTQGITNSPDLVLEVDDDRTGGAYIQGNTLHLGTEYGESLRVKATYLVSDRSFTAYETFRTTEPQTLSSIEIYSNDTQISAGETLQLSCRANFTNPTQQRNVTNEVNFSISSGSSAGYISGNTFHANSGISSNTTITVSASYTSDGRTKSDTYQFTVDVGRVLQSIQISGSTSVDVNRSLSLSATAHFSSYPTTQNVSGDCNWSMSGYAQGCSVSSQGIFSSGSAGNLSATVQASYTYQGVTKTDSHNITVNQAQELDYITIGGPSSIESGGDIVLTATGTYSNPYETKNIKTLGNWTVTDAGAVTDYHYDSLFFPGQFRDVITPTNTTMRIKFSYGGKTKYKSVSVNAAYVAPTINYWVMEDWKVEYSDNGRTWRRKELPPGVELDWHYIALPINGKKYFEIELIEGTLNQTAYFCVDGVGYLTMVPNLQAKILYDNYWNGACYSIHQSGNPGGYYWHGAITQRDPINSSEVPVNSVIGIAMNTYANGYNISFNNDWAWKAERHLKDFPIHTFKNPVNALQNNDVAIPLTTNQFYIATRSKQMRFRLNTNASECHYSPPSGHSYLL